MPLQAITSTEPIPGYQIVERIGAGGYGEVWRAQAPGGLVKAIKFVYGYLDEDRASRELKALNRIKDVRHPFLLSLERIEVVDGQLLIVTELAEGSLKDRFDACLAAGATGIDRQEILAYMRDASDVLDYMSEQHSLQHLDIKPENLLLVGDRIKVADFGLVKELRDVTASLMGGLTPLYAPPEVFDGRPSRWSDQYSLAIVYQEMLTGELPFPGKTAAQLARQHLNARPRLSALPEHDRAVIARALSKDPRERFQNCRALIEHLFRSDANQAGNAGSIPDTQPIRGDSVVTERTDRRVPKRQTAVLQEVPITRLSDASCRVPQIVESPEIRSLHPLDVTEAEPALRPTVFVGIGKSAGCVLPRLIRRLTDRFGRLSEVPAFQFTLFDTDAKDLMTAAHADPSGTLSAENMLNIPLRRPQDYKNDSRKILQWLSRRWLYNIPRSLKTEGLRPLGRLAFVDHADSVMDRIAKALRAAASDDAITRSCETTGLECRNKQPRVVLVTSISGGTGGGMFSDIAYGIRNLLMEMGLDDHAVTGVLLHSTSRNARGKELAIVNAYASLVELNHYSRPGGIFPGDSACNLPSKEGDDNAAFRHTYVVHLGDDLADGQFEDSLQQVAEYLYLDSATAAGAFFDEARQHEPSVDETADEISIRSFGVHEFSCSQEDIVGWVGDRLCHGLAELWFSGGITLSRAKTLGTAREDSAVRLTPLLAKDELARIAAEKADSLSFDAAKLITQMFNMIEQEVSEQPDRFLQREVQGLRTTEDVDQHADQEAAWVASAVQYLERLVGPARIDQAATTTATEPVLLENQLIPLRRRYIFALSQDVREWVLSLVDRADVRVRGGQTLIDSLQQRIEDIRSETSMLQEKVLGQLAQAHAQLTAMVSSDAKLRQRARKGQPDLTTTVLQYARLRLYFFVLQGTTRLGQAIKGQLSQTFDELIDLGRELKHLRSQFPVDELRVEDPEDDGEEQNSKLELMRAVARAVQDSLADLILQVDEAVHHPWLDEQGGLVKVLTEGGTARERLPETMRAAARSVVTTTLRQLDVADMLFAEESAEHEPAEEDKTTESLRQSLDSARPKLWDCGGAKRLLVMLPAGSTDVRPLEVLHRQFKETPSVVNNADGDFVVCYELEQMSLTQAAVSLIEGRRDFAQFAHRLFTRNDVRWTSLPDLVGPGAARGTPST